MAGEHITFDQYLALFGEDTSRVELVNNEMWAGGRPFYDLVKDYLALRGETVCPLDD